MLPAREQRALLDVQDGVEELGRLIVRSDYLEQQLAQTPGFIGCVVARVMGHALGQALQLRCMTSVAVP